MQSDKEAEFPQKAHKGYEPIPKGDKKNNILISTIDYAAFTKSLFYLLLYKSLVQYRAKTPICEPHTLPLQLDLYDVIVQISATVSSSE